MRRSRNRWTLWLAQDGGIAMELSSQQLALKAKAAALSNELIRKRAAQIDQSGEYPWDVVEALKAEHFMGMTIPKKYGGQGRSFLDTVLVVEEMARSCTVSARIVVEANMGAISTVMAYGTDAQRKRAADLVLAGDKPAICITEPDAGSDASGMKTRADKRGNRCVLNGRKHWITGAGVSRLHVRMFTIGGGTAQVLRTLIASKVLGWKLPQRRDGYAKSKFNAEQD
jgi:3-sulfinopropanoyl-CoA desulfinase